MSKTTSYIPGNSLLYKLDPRIKFIIVILFTIQTFILKSFLSIGLLFVSIGILWMNTKLSFKLIVRYMKILLVIFIILLVMQSIFYEGNTYLVKPLIPSFVPGIGGMGSITLEGLLFGLLLCLRVLTLICLLPLLMFTTTVEDLSLGLVKLGLPYKVSFTATTALNQIPILESEVASIMNAQKLRGFTTFETGSKWEKIKSFPTLVVPLVMGAMRRANMMGVAMDSRAFGAYNTRTFVNKLQIKSNDWIAVIVSIVYMIVLYYINYAFKGVI